MKSETEDGETIADVALHVRSALDAAMACREQEENCATNLNTAIAAIGAADSILRGLGIDHKSGDRGGEGETPE